MSESEKNWYVLRVYTGQEETVKKYLEQEGERLGFKDYFGQILIPTETIIEMRDGKKRERNKVFFPGYIILEVELQTEVTYFILEAPNVISFADNSDEPQPLRQFEINRILGRVEETRGQVTVDIPFQIDDKVKINDGPFKDFIGSIKEINEEKRKLKVLVSIFGRSTPVEVDFLQVTTNITD